jgi:hypothetical protein
MPIIRLIINFLIPDFGTGFKLVATNIEGFFYFFSISYLDCNQIWLNLPIDDRHFGYFTKLTPKNSIVLQHGRTWMPRVGHVGDERVWDKNF